MKQLIDNLKTALKDSRGESLMESLASLLILTILITAVTTVIMASLNITAISTREAAERQDNVNSVIMENHSGTADLTLTGTDAAINVTIEVELSDEDGYVAFAPPEA